MAPSITEDPVQAIQQIHEKVTAKIAGKLADEPKAEAKPDTAPAVQGPPTETPAPEAPVVEPATGRLPRDEFHLETGHKEPLKLSGVLDKYESFDVTPVIGREFVDVDLAGWLRAPNSDELIRDLAITSRLPNCSSSQRMVVLTKSSQVSRRGVVFFRKQDNITNDLQKELVQRLGELSGKPATSKLHIHPVSNSGRELGGKDDEISVISSEQAKKIYINRFWGKKQSSKEQWHSDITFEPIPSDYALLRLVQLPKTGGGE